MFSPFHFMETENFQPLMLFTFTILISNWQVKMKFAHDFLKFYVLRLILMMNLSSLIPYTFCATSYIWGNFLMTLCLCLSFTLANFFFNQMHFFSHLVPLGSPLSLSLILVYLEITSLLMQPLTLALRLACNMMAGHVMITLICSGGILMQTMLCLFTMFEMMISILQSQVFSMLVSIYSSF